MKKLIVAVIIVIIAGVFDYLKKDSGNTSPITETTTSNSHSPPTTTTQYDAKPSPTQDKAQEQILQKIRQAAQSQKSGWWLETTATVIKRLRDDTKGHPHQKFLIKLAPDITLLVAHNLDLAQRVPLKEGDSIQLRGRYEWNNRGGVLHWTHHDPKGRQTGGWIKHKGKDYR